MGEVDEARRYHGLDLKSVGKRIGMDVCQNLRVGDYAAHPGIGYWFIDGVDKLGISLDEDMQESSVAIGETGSETVRRDAEEGNGFNAENPWTKSAQWACAELHRQMALVSSDHHVLMDPVAMVMAACVCKRLRTMAECNDDVQEQLVPFLPSETELRHGVKVFFKKQLESGVWPNFFPMFHYPGAGANHCWTFEVLEAILGEFDELVSDSGLLDQLCLAVEWCEQYRLTWRGNGWRKKHAKEAGRENTEEDEAYRGWNSGGQQSTLEKGEPESWATGVVHMFLDRLEARLAEAIRQQLFSEYDVSTPITTKLWQSTIDTEINLRGQEQPQSIRQIIDDNMINPIKESADNLRLPKKVKRSVLLFGPPGTGKTRFVRAIAEEIGWHFLPINPSMFLMQGLGGIYAQTNKLFSDLRDLYRTVVFFDEMDAMLQKRVGKDGKIQLTIEQQFLTTSMLPHLTELYDAEQVLFFVATNYGKTFDTAITRPGRFDMLLFIGPPDWKTKVEYISQLAELNDKTTRSDDLMNKLKETLLRWVPAGDNTALNYATFGEMRAMMQVLCGGKNLDDAIADETLNEAVFHKTVGLWEKDRFALCKNKDLRDQYEEEKDTSEIR